MSLLGRMGDWDGCLQCWAEGVLGAEPAAIEAELERQFTADPRLGAGGGIGAADLARMTRAGRRETRLLARLALLEPHECGRQP